MKKINWDSLGFNYTETKWRYVSLFKDGNWGAGAMTKKSNIVLNESANVFQYAQTGFEGLKVFTAHDGSIVAFRPELNAQRLQDTCDRIMMPKVSTEQFLDAVNRVVIANKKWVPPYGSGAALYIRPFVMGITPVLSINPSTEYMFRVYACPVGPYFKNDFKPLKLMISDYDRAAPNGTGNVKAGLNYAMSMQAGIDAKAQGFDECLFLDAKTRTYIDEAKAANIIFITKDNKLVTPKSDTILPSITRRSLLVVAKDYLGITIEERPIRYDEIGSFIECGLCGTAAVIAPLQSISHKGKEIQFQTSPDGKGELIKKLYDTYTDIQTKKIPAPDGWIHTITGDKNESS